MRFRWDWLSPVAPVPYVPTLGPVQPRALSAQLFNAVVDIADTGRFLPYDKDRRWSGRKDERVIVDGIVHEPGLTMIPTFTRGRGLVKIHHYGDSPLRPSELTQGTPTQWAPLSVTAGRVIWFQRAPEGARTRLWTTGPSTRFSKPPQVVHQSCFTCPKAWRHSVSCAAGTCRGSPGERLLIQREPASVQYR
jgi:hypothetical protein